MQKFVYEYATKVYFGEGAAKEHLAAAVSGYGENVMLAYGGGSIKKNGIYDEVKKILEDAGKKVFDFSGIMSNPTYAKVQEGAKLAKEKKIPETLSAGISPVQFTVGRRLRTGCGEPDAGVFCDRRG